MSDLQVPEIERLRPVFQRGPDEASNMEPHPDGGYVEFQVVTQLREEIAELNGDKGELVEKLAGAEERVTQLQDRIEELEGLVRSVNRRAEIAEVRIAEQEEALRFYADPDTYFAIGLFADPPCGDFVHDLEEIDGVERPGKRARAALTNTKGSSDAE